MDRQDSAMVPVKINGLLTEVAEGSTILDAAEAAGIRIPTLCYLRKVNAISACRICLVEIKGVRGWKAACVHPVERSCDGAVMEVFTNTPALIAARRRTLELILSGHRIECGQCVRSTDCGCGPAFLGSPTSGCQSCVYNTGCELQRLSREYGVDEGRYLALETAPEVDDSFPPLIKDDSKCIRCRRCVAVCAKDLYVGVIATNARGLDTHIGPAFDAPLATTACTACGQCAAVCPTGALTVKDETDEVALALADPTVHTVALVVPSLLAGLAECFDLPTGTDVKGRTIKTLKTLGFDEVIDADAAAETLLSKAASELSDHLGDGSTLPLLASTCPAWASFARTSLPRLTGKPSTSKSPLSTLAALARSASAKGAGQDAKAPFVVALTPCTAMKAQTPPEGGGSGRARGIDATLTVTGLADLIKRTHLDLAASASGEADTPPGIRTGKTLTFSASGGILEAVLARAGAEARAGAVAAGLGPSASPFSEVPDLEGVSGAVYELGSSTLKVAVVTGLANAVRLLEAIRSGEEDYDYVEVMACPGGCLNGGGQPALSGFVRNYAGYLEQRCAALDVCYNSCHTDE